MSWGTWLRAGAWLVAFVAFVPAHAGQLVLTNSSGTSISCKVDGWTKASGYSADVAIIVPPGTSADNAVRVTQNPFRATQVIDSVECGALRTRAMNITPAGPDGVLVLTGTQQRVLNVALYPYLPAEPGAAFQALLAHVVDEYQRANPQVLLSVQMNPGTDVYDFANLKALLGVGRLDVIEMDTLLLKFVVDEGLVNEMKAAGDPIDVARAAATVDGKLWAIPSWLCLDFLYSEDAAVRSVTSLSALAAFLKKVPSGKPKLAAVYNGSWRLPSMYINSYVQTHGYGKISQAMTLPLDAQVIDQLVTLTDLCATAAGNPCTNGFYKGRTELANGATERVFATGHAAVDVGFSEQSYFINYSGQIDPLYAVPAPWGATPQPLLFSDAFVTSRASCAASPCAADAAAFTNLMTGVPMKKYIVLSQDSGNAAPRRTLLAASRSFYDDPEIRRDPLYAQFRRAIDLGGKPFPNNFTKAIKDDMRKAVCTALKAKRPEYSC